MLIIFDLDDTLIDTSGSITPWKMRGCLTRMIQEGLVVSSFEEAYNQLLAINSRSKKSGEALHNFAQIYRATPRQMAGAMEELTAPLPREFEIATTPHAKEILNFYKEKYPLILVTGGYPPFQWEKLKKSGIDHSLFSMIAIPEDSKKKPYYEAVQREFSIPSEQIWVCGDRLEMDLLPAYELGFKTVHMKWGRGILAKREKWVEHAISNLRELKDIIK